MAKKAGLVVLGTVLGVMVTVAVTVALRWPQTEVVYRNAHPATVKYKDGSQHHLGLIRVEALWGGESHRLVVGRDPEFTYGHLVELDGNFDTVPELRVERTEWTEAGVRVRFNTGHEVFVPARMFTFGR